MADVDRLFRKCRGGRMSEAERLRQADAYPYFLPIEEGTPTRVRIRGEWKIMLGSNNYLGLTHHPTVLHAVEDALHRYGSGATGSRLLTGNTDIHQALEERFARLWEKDAALVFTTGYQANLGVISALLGREDHVFLDRQAHASALQGARLGTESLHRYPHQDVDALDEMLSRVPERAGALVVTDGVFSMEGDLLDLPSLLPVVQRRGANLLLDDAHGLGVLGEGGRGTAAHFGLQAEVDLLMATFSKSLASVGGVVAGPGDVITYLRHTSHPLLFSAGLPPASAAGVLAALTIMEEEPEHREHLWHNSHLIYQGLQELGLKLGEGKTPVVPIYMESERQAFIYWRELFHRDVLVLPVVPPAVGPNTAIMRVSVTAAHTEDQIEKVLEAFREASRAVGLI